MIFQFGNVDRYVRPKYSLTFRFENAAGIHEATIIRKNGIVIGSVSQIGFDERQHSVLVHVEIEEQYRLHTDAVPILVSSLLGDTLIDITPGKEKSFASAGSTLFGQTPEDPLTAVKRVEERLAETMTSLVATSREWEKVGKNLNRLVDTNQGNLNQVVEQAATAIVKFSKTMESAHGMFAEATKLLGNEENQKNLQKSLAAMPRLVTETESVIHTMQLAIKNANRNLENLAMTTKPLAEKSDSIVTQLDQTVRNLSKASREMNIFLTLLNRKDGTVRKLVEDPELYRNLNRSASSMAVLLKNVEPVMRDLRIFSDRIARHPELLGVSGAIKGSSGIKDPNVQPAGRTQISRRRSQRK